MVTGRAGIRAAALAALPLLTAAAQTPPADPPFIVRTELSERSPWERSQVLYTVRIYLPPGSGRFGRIRSLDDPVLLSGEALIERFGTDREYNARSRDAESLVLERRYALFPQVPGELLLMPVSLQWIGGQFGFRTRGFVQDSEPERLEVRPIPGPPAGVWLAAEEVRIWDEFERAPDDLTAGEPLIRLLAVRVVGQPARQIPELSPGDGPNFRHFIERPEFEDIVTGRGLVGVRRQRAALLALRGGDLVLPAIRLDWWNTIEERWQTAEVPRRLLQAQAPPAQTIPETADVPVAPSPLVDRLFPFLLAGWFLTVVAWWVSHRISASRRRRAGFLSRIPPGVGGARPTMSRRLADLAHACGSNDPRSVEQALLAWAQAYWGDGAPRNLSELGERLREPAAAELRRLSVALYASGGGAWNAEVLLAAARRPPPRSAPTGTSRGGLPRLWPGETAENG